MNRSSAHRLLRTGLTVLALSMALLVAPATSASAASPRPPAPSGVQADVCQKYSNGLGDLCLWYFRGASGSRAAFYDSDPSLHDNVFVTPGAGQGQVVANNSESYFNMDTKYKARVCTNTHGGGSCTDLMPNTAGNLPSGFVNNVESITWIWVGP